MKFKDKVVIVTGSGAGIGREAAIHFAKDGAKVVVGTLNKERGDEVVNYIKTETNGDALFVPLDVSDSQSVKKMVDTTVATFGSIDILVNNAGIYAQGNVVDTTEEAWNKLLAVNLTGSYLCSHHVIPYMLRNKSGIIVNVSSEAGLVGMANQTAYNVSKAGLISMTKSMALDFAQSGIRVNAVCPGTTETPLVKKVLAEASNPDEIRRNLESVRPLNRLGQPEEIAKAILALASDELGYATGAVLAIDGGYTAQ